MKPTTRLWLYWLAVHVVFGAIGLVWLQEQPLKLICWEGGLVISLLIGRTLTQRVLQPLELLTHAVETLKGGSFSQRLRPTRLPPPLDEWLRWHNQWVEQLQQEQVRLQEQYWFVEQTLNVSPLGTLIFDFDNKIVTCNPSAQHWLHLKSPEAWRGKTLADLSGSLSDCLQRLKPGHSEVVTVSGRHRIKCQHLQFVDRGFSRSFMILEELTEELRKSEKAAYETLIRTLSHEVNNSLGSINSLLQSCLGYASQLESDDQKDFQTALQVSIQRADHLNAFMQRYAEVVRLPPPHRSPCDVQPLLTDLVRLFQPQTTRHQIQWQWHVEDAFPTLLMDRNQMEQVFLNLLKNAIEAVPQQGFIALHLTHTQRTPTVIVEDSGPGIDETLLNQMFTPFFTTKPEGTGIGLTLVQEILMQHGFEFGVDSQPGGPTRFMIYFK